MAEPVTIVPGASKEVVNSCLAHSNNVTVSVQTGKSMGPESSDLRPQLVPDPTNGTLFFHHQCNAGGRRCQAWTADHFLGYGRSVRPHSVSNRWITVRSDG